MTCGQLKQLATGLILRAGDHRSRAVAAVTPEECTSHATAAMVLQGIASALLEVEEDE